MSGQRVKPDPAMDRQMRQMLVDLCGGLISWAALYPQIADELPRASDQSDEATARRLRLLRTIVERGERCIPSKRRGAAP